MSQRGPDDGGVQTVCLLILALLAVGVSLALLKPLLVPFVLAVFLTYCLAPLIELLRRELRLPDMVAIVGAGLVGVVALTLIGALVTVAVSQIVGKFDRYQQQVEALNRRVLERVPLE